MAEAGEAERLPSEFAGREARVEIPFKELKLEKEIGKGAFSRVYRGKYQGNKVAIKKMKLPGLGDAQREDQQKYINTELAILTAVSHPNLLKYYGAAYKGDNVYIITELMEADLRDVLKKRGTDLSWQLRARIARDAFEGIAELHNTELVHRDIKTDNILLDEPWRAVVADYGFARKAVTSQAMTICGTDEFMAPEVIFGEVYDQRADIFSFGMVLVEVITLRQPGKRGFLERQPRTNFRLDLDAFNEAVPEDCPVSLAELARQCLAYEADDRIDTEIVRDWLRDLCDELDASAATGEQSPAAMIRAAAPAPPSPEAVRPAPSKEDAVPAVDLAAAGGGGETE